MSVECVFFFKPLSLRLLASDQPDCNTEMKHQAENQIDIILLFFCRVIMCVFAPLALAVTVSYLDYILLDVCRLSAILRIVAVAGVF